MDNTVFAFGPFRLHPAERLLLKEETPVRLGSRALEILFTLVERAGETVLKDQLIARVWPDTVVGEAALRVHVTALRKALGDGRDGQRFIVNIPSQGYVFVAPVRSARRVRDSQATLPVATANDPPRPLVNIVSNTAQRFAARPRSVLHFFIPS